MFTYLNFRMENSIGVPVSVSLRCVGGKIHYGVGFVGIDSWPETNESLNLSNSSRLSQRIDQLGLVDILSHYEREGLNEGGDYWQIHIEHMLGQIDLSGPRESHSVIAPLIQDFADILDDSLSITRFINPMRIDRLEIEFQFNEWDPEMKDNAEDYSTLLHSEIVTLDRPTNTIRYSKRFPARCSHVNLECRCDEEVRSILDQSEMILSESRYFEDIHDSRDLSPELRFTFSFHDKSVVHVHRQLSLDGLRDMIYEQMINVIYEDMLSILFRLSLFDKRMLLPEHLRKEIPFFVAYRDDDGESDEDSEAEA